MIAKNIVYIYNSSKVLKKIKTFDTLEECFNFILKESNKNAKRKTTGNKNKIRKYTTNYNELF